MTYSQATQYWNALSPEQKQMFYNYASKSEGQHTAFEWFNYLVPDELKDNPSEVEVYMNGGTVVTTDGDTVDISDKDLSRLESGHNGGEYTTENTVMEDASINRARGSSDMTSAELEATDAANAADVELIDGAEIVADVTEVTTGAGDAATTASEFLGATADVLTDALAPIIGAGMAGKAVYDHCDKVEDKLGYGSLAAGGAALISLHLLVKQALLFMLALSLLFDLRSGYPNGFWQRPINW